MNGGGGGIINLVLHIFEWVFLLQRAYLIFTIKTKSHNYHLNNKKGKIFLKPRLA